MGGPSEIWGGPGQKLGGLGPPGPIGGYGTACEMTLLTWSDDANIIDMWIMLRRSETKSHMMISNTSHNKIS